MQEFDQAVSELFKSGIAFFMLSIFTLMFDKKIAHFLRMIAYLQLISVLLTIVLAGFNIMNSLIEALNNLSNWSLFGGFKD